MRKYTVSTRRGSREEHFAASSHIDEGRLYLWATENHRPPIVAVYNLHEWESVKSEDSKPPKGTDI